ncbi:putative toxin-antitoxin system toxin component, PIN family [Lacipirellula limnantheis]|uniref:PIN domain protein n=1 Tax=Lacipirellula limnantheis TaxID=2528024 RepID=A0A517U6T1_9BACT|nr:putative toxin-antitoxin system toxin component, PIN family [Lacipirellula limnantheis]QDT76324.1 PIN domain protein [Lacipirellula limnantheis]
MKPPDRVVFDCNVFFQAFISGSGPAGQLLQAVSEKSLTLFVSAFVLEELTDVLSRPHLASQFKFTRERVAEYLDSLVQLATMTTDVPHVFEFPRDPKDAHYVDLALAVDAKLIVSRDKDLLSLRDAATGEGRDFLSRYPGLLILTPPEVLKLLAATLPPK